MLSRYPRLLATLVPIAVLATLLVLWILLTPEPIPELVFPSPESLLQALRSLGWDLWKHAGATLGRVTLGWAIGVPLGVLLGLAMHRSVALRLAVHPIVEGIRPLPPIALIPFFIVWFGLSLAGQIALIALGCFMVMAVNSFTALRQVPPVYLRAATMLRAPTSAIYRTILLPAIVPSLIGGFRISAALAFGVAVAAEMMGAQEGIGFVMMVARRTLNTNTILLGIIIIGVQSYLFDVFLRYLGRRLTRWSETSIDEQLLPF